MSDHSSPYDMLIRGGTVVVPRQGATRADIGVRAGRIVAIGQDLDGRGVGEVIDADGRLVVPGAVDAHYHLGIYREMAGDTRSETASSVLGGVTTVLSYFRTGSHYLETSGPYAEVFPKVLEIVADNAYCDYGFHLAPMLGDHVGEIPDLVSRHGVTSFKYYMFYRGLDLAGDSSDAAGYTKSTEYDLAHLLRIMEAIRDCNDGSAGRVSVGIHAEHPELIKHFLEVVKLSDLTGLEAYSAARPPLTERLAISEVSVLASHTRAAVNLLHLSSRDALDEARQLKANHPDLDVRLETTLHHLALSYDKLEGHTAKVNPPIRTPDDNEALWDGIARGDISWVVSDHACCGEELKDGPWYSALPGFGGTALLYPILLTEGWKRRGMDLADVVALITANPAEAFGIAPRKGTIAIGADADLVVIDPERSRRVTADGLLSAQEFTPFEGFDLIGWPDLTILRGQVVYRDGDTVGEPAGQYLARPLAEGGDPA